MGQFRELYSGGDYTLHFKYSGVLNIVYISCMYGMGMPVMFLLGAFNFFNQWVCERFIVCYLVKLPAALDDKLTNNCIAMLKWAPLLFILNGYWMLSNTQFFENGWSYIPDSLHEMPSGHHLQPFLHYHALPAFFMVCTGLFLIVVEKVYDRDFLIKASRMMTRTFLIDEDLPNFFKAVRLSQADVLVKESENMENNFLIQPNDPDTVRTLNATSMPQKAIQGTPWYDVLTNTNYSNPMTYIGAFVDEREKLIEDGYPETTNAYFKDEERQIRFEQCDLVYILLHMAYVPDSIINNQGLEDSINWEFNFDHGWQFYFKKKMEAYIANFNKKVEAGLEVNIEDDRGNVDHTSVYDVEWKLQDAELEDRYKQFKEMRDAELRVPVYKPSGFKI
jgi:hypothetical protein